MGQYGFMIFWTKNSLNQCNSTGVLNTHTPRQLTYIFNPARNRVKVAINLYAERYEARIQYQAANPKLTLLGHYVTY